MYRIQDSENDEYCCVFCGEPLKNRSLTADGQVKYVMKNVFLPCECDDANEYWRCYHTAKKERERQLSDREIAENKEKYIKRIIKNSGIKDKFKTRTFKNFKKNSDNNDAYGQCVNYVNSFDYAKGRGLYFTGSVGTGKTHLAAAIANHLMQKKKQVIFRSSVELLDDIKRAYADNENAYNVIDVFKKAELLVLDDLGKEIPKDFAVTTIFSILDSRYENNLPVIVTTNYNDVQLIDRLSAHGGGQTAKAIVSRLYEMCELVEMSGKDYRMIV